MKKISIITICLVLFFTQVSFANTFSVEESLKDIDMVSNRMHIIIKQITGDDTLNIDELNRDIKFCESILSTRAKKISNEYSNKSDVEVGKICSALLYTTSLYESSLASITMYINNDSETNYFIDACASYREGKSSLHDLSLQCKK